MRIGSSLGQYFVGTATFMVEKLDQNKDMYRKATFSKQVLLHRKNFERTNNNTKVLLQKKRFFRTATFWKKLIFRKIDIPHYVLFLGSQFVRVVTF